jgi:hypothetical protein
LENIPLKWGGGITQWHRKKSKDGGKKSESVRNRKTYRKGGNGFKGKMKRKGYGKNEG